MKRISYFVAFILFFNISYSQNAMNCCVGSATEKFASLASNKSFVDVHDDPLPFTGEQADGHAISFKTPDGKEGYGWEIISPARSDNYLFVFHEWWGLNDYIKQEAEKLSKDLKINVIAIDLYDKRMASTAEEASKLVRSVNTDRAMSIIHGAYDYVGKNAKVFTIGWCFGGAWSLQAATEGGNQVKGCVMFYGMPEDNVDRLRKLNCDVIGFFANKDQGITPAVVDEFLKNMQAAGKKLYVYRYDAVHAFANPSNPNYDKAATEDAYKKLIAFIRERM